MLIGRLCAEPAVVRPCGPAMRCRHSTAVTPAALRGVGVPRGSRRALVVRLREPERACGRPRGRDRRRAWTAGSRGPLLPPRDDEDRGLKGVSAVLRDLAVLTPPLLVCVAFLIAVGAFLRHEMGASRRRRDRDASGDISRDGTIPDTASSQASTQSDDEDASGAD